MYLLIVALWQFWNVVTCSIVQLPILFVLIV